MKRSLLVIGVVAGAMFAACDHHHGGGPAPPSGVNPVQHEMRLLNDAMRDTVTAIANGDVRKVPESFHNVHGAKEHTAAALKSGAYKPPKNSDKVARFVEVDEQLHGDLEQLVEAASKNDVNATAAALGHALGKCQGCHTEFRF